MSLIDTFLQDKEEIVANELKRARPNMDYLKGLGLSRE
jgi:hypothetical protein